MNDTTPPQRGDVESIDWADSDSKPETHRRVAIRLHAHPCHYLVRVTTDSTSGPTIAELTIVADDGHSVDYGAVRAVPVRRLAHSAQQWISSAGGVLHTPGRYPGDSAAPENADPIVTELHWRIDQAVMNGLPVRETLANDLGVGKRTVDRMIAKARAAGELDGVEIPRRPSPKQRDGLTARYLAEDLLAEYGPHGDIPPERLVELDRLRSSTTTDDQETDE